MPRPILLGVRAPLLPKRQRPWPMGKTPTPGETAAALFGIPTLADEQATYDLLGWTSAPADKVFEFSATPSGGFGDLHNDTEADDLWTWYQQNERYGSALTSAWKAHWRSAFLANYYTALTTGNEPTYTYDHVYGQGLACLYQAGDTSVLPLMNQLMTLIGSQTVTPGVTAMSYYEGRQRGRWLLVACYAAQVTGNATHISVRDNLIDAWVQSPDWEEGGVIKAGGCYFASREQSTYVSGSGGTASYDAGRRFQSAFQLGVVVEALWRAYLVTGRSDVREKLIKIAQYVRYYAHRSTWVYPNVGARFGHEGDGTYWHITSTDGAVDQTSKDCSYDTALVNTQVVGYKLSGDTTFLTFARKLLSRGTHFAAGAAGEGGGGRVAPDNEVHHFADTLANPDGCYFEYNKGELQYNYQVFENGGRPTIAPVSGSTAIDTLAAGMGAGTWAQLTIDTSLLVDSAPGGVGSIVTYADKICYDPVRRRAWFTDSDDPGAGRRTVYLDFATNAFVLVNGTVDSTQRGVSHIYAGQTIDVKNRRYWTASGTGSVVSWFDLDVSGTQSPTSISVPWGEYQAHALEYFPERDSMFFVHNTVTYERPVSTGTWATFASIPSSTHRIGIYNRYHRCLVVGGGNDTPNALRRIDANGTVTVLSDATPFAIDCVRTEFIEDPTTGNFDVYYHAQTSIARWRFNPMDASASAWTNIGTADAPNIVLSNGGYDIKLLSVATIIPECKVHLWFADFDGGSAPQVWLYKYAS